MGDRGETATSGSAPARCWNYSRWEIGEKPQRSQGHRYVHAHYSRWEIGEKPQRRARRGRRPGIIADGRSGRNRNGHSLRGQRQLIIADGRSGRNRNSLLDYLMARPIIADGRSGRNRNLLPRETHRHNYSRWEIGEKPQQNSNQFCDSRDAITSSTTDSGSVVLISSG